MVDIFDEIELRPSRPVKTPAFEDEDQDADIFEQVSIEEPKKSFFKRGFGLAPETEEEVSRIATGLGREFVGEFLGLPGEIQAGFKSLFGIGEEMPQIFPRAETVREKLFDPFQRAVGIAEEPVTEAKTELEKIGRRAAGIAGSFVSPVGPAPKALTVLLASTLPAISESITKKLGASESVQAGVSALTMLGSALATKKFRSPKEVMKSLFNKAESLVPEGASIEAKALTRNLENLDKSLRKGIITPSKAQPLRAIRQIKNKIQDGKIGIDELLASKRDVNELIRDPETLRRARNVLKPIAKNVDNAIESYGKTNPEFLKNFRDANKLFGEINNVPKIIKFLDKKTDLKKVDPITSAFLLLKPKIFVKALGGKKVLQGFDVLLRKPKIRSLYFQAIGKASKESSKGLQNIVNQLDKEIRKEKETNPDIFESL